MNCYVTIISCLFDYKFILFTVNKNEKNNIVHKYLTTNS